MRILLVLTAWLTATWAGLAAQVFPAATNRANYFYFQNEFGSNVIVGGWLHVDGDITNSAKITTVNITANGAVNGVAFNRFAPITNSSFQIDSNATFTVKDGSGDFVLAITDTDGEATTEIVGSLAIDGALSATGTFSGDGQGLTNLNGATIQTGTVNSNALDVATAAQLALAGTLPADGEFDNLTVNNTLMADELSVGTLIVTNGINSTNITWEATDHDANGASVTNLNVVRATSFTGDGSALTGLTNGLAPLTNASFQVPTNGTFTVSDGSGDTVLGITDTDGEATTEIVGSVSIDGALSATGEISGDGNGITNLDSANVLYWTNSTTMAPNFSLPYSMITTNDAFTFLAPLNVSATLAQTAVILVTNSTATVKVVRPPANVHTNGVWNVTNMTTFTFFNYGGVITNAIAFPLW